MPQFAPPYEATASYDSGVLDRDLQYKYPMGLDLRPNSEVHKRIINECMKRARESQAKMSKRWPVWRELERNVTAYVPLDNEEARTKENDSRKPVRVVVPFSYLMRDINLTYLSGSLLEGSINRLNGTGPEDMLGAMLLQQVLDTQNIRFKNGIAYYIQFQDALTYGFGVVTPTWEVETGYRTQWSEGQYDTPFGPIPTGQMVRTTVESVTAEGNQIHNIDPYCYFPDPNVPLHRVQDGEYVGWVRNSNYNKLLSEDNVSYFNVKYLEGIEGTSSLLNSTQSGREDKYGSSGTALTRARNDYSKPVDLLIQYVNLVPAEWKIGNKDVPEKWLFVIGGDQIVLMATPVRENHRKFPVGVCCPNLDGYSISPISALEICYPLQEVADFVYSSRLAAVRRVLADRYLINPSLIDAAQFMDSRNNVISLRPSAWGQPLNNALQQLEVRDVTAGHFKDLQTVAELIERVTGAVDILQGVAPDSGNERTTARQVDSQRSAATSRLKKMARLISEQSMYDMTYFCASQTQQYMEQPQWVRVIGQWQEALAADLGPSGRMQVMPWDLDCAFDIMPHDGSMPDDGAMAATVKMALDQALTSPEINMAFDPVRMYANTWRLAGIKNIDDFRRIMPPAMQVQAMPDDQVNAEVEAGNMRPMNEAANAA